MDVQAAKQGMAAKISLALASTLIAIFLIEGCLQLAALALQAGGREIRKDWRAGNVRVLTLGDSNTFGLYLEPNESYPSQLQALWNETHDALQVEVINLGYPSTNSSRLLANFERLLETFEPSVVIVQIGVNDYWTAPIELDHDSLLTEPKMGELVKRYSRLYKLLYILRQSAFDPEALEVEYNRDGLTDGTYEMRHTGVVRYGGESFVLSGSFAKGTLKDRIPVGTGDKSQGLFLNLSTMIRIALSREVEMVVLTYPSDSSFYRAANRVLRRFATASGVPFADAGRDIVRHCRGKDCSDLFLPDFHATAKGNAMVAAAASEVLGAVLR